MAIPICVVDAFAEALFQGNPAAVCRLLQGADEAWMQAVAAEMNLSETAFLVPRADGHWDLRWFTPKAEVALCGHATLASAHALWESESTVTDRIRFHTRSGWLECVRGEGGIVMDFPRRDCRNEPVPAELASLLGGSGVVGAGRSDDDWLVELPDAASVRAARPDLGALAKFPVRGLMVTARSDRSDFDFVSRFFAPSVGVSEDPVTGSAHCTLGPYWAERLGRTRLRGWQASARGGAVGVEVTGDRVKLSGRAVTVWTGELR